MLLGTHGTMIMSALKVYFAYGYKVLQELSKTIPSCGWNEKIDLGITLLQIQLSPMEVVNPKS